MNQVSQWTSSSVLGGLKSLGSGILHFGEAVKDCASAGQEVDDLGEMASMFTDPPMYGMEVGQHLLVNGADIGEDMWNAVKSFGQGDYYNTGVNVGKALALTALGGTNGGSSGGSFDSGSDSFSNEFLV